MITIVEANACEPGRLYLTFSDGTAGIADVSDVPHVGVFERWDDPHFFEEVKADVQLGTVVWPNGADLDPYVLYSKVRGLSIEQALAAAFPNA